MCRNELEIFIAFSVILLYVVVDSWKAKCGLKYVIHSPGGLVFLLVLLLTRDHNQVGALIPKRR